MDLKNARLLVTPTSYGKNEPRLKTELEELAGSVTYNPTGKPLSSKEVAALLPGVDGYIAGLDVIDRAALESADRLKVIARYGVGVDQVDLEAAKEKGIIVTNTPGANSVSVAELALGLMLALARQIPEAVRSVQKGLWPRYAGVSLEGKTVGILGLGAIGKQLARRLAGFDCQILAYDPYVDQIFAKERGIGCETLETVIAEADFVSLHLPLLPETRGLVNDQFLAKMKKGAFLINTSRGGVVDQEALYHALKEKKIAGAALDVFEPEPLVADSPLRSLDNVYLAPHVAGQTFGSARAMGLMAAENVMAILNGTKPPFAVNSKELGL